MLRSTWVRAVVLLGCIAGLMPATLALAPASAPGQAARKAAPAERGERRIDINKGSAAQLATIPGIGEVLAKRIVEFREKNGPFRRVEDILKVRGIGEKSFQKFRARLTVKGSK